MVLIDWLVVWVDEGEYQLIEDDSAEPQSSDADPADKTLLAWEIFVGIVDGQHVRHSLTKTNSYPIPQNPPHKMVSVRKT